VLGCLVVLVLAAAAVYAYLPLRSAMDPPLDYADPQSWDAFWYVVLGRQFQGSFGQLPALPEIASGAWDMVVGNVGPLVILVPAGAVLGALRHPRLVVLTALWFVCSWLFALGYPNASIERYYLVPLLAAATWVGLAADVAWDALGALLSVRGRRGDRLGAAGAGPTRPVDRVARLVPVGLVALLVAASLSAAPDRREDVDASRDTFGRDWLEATLAALPRRAAVISWWSFSTPLWYGRWVEGRREDIVIVDDRDVIDDGYGTVEGAIERFLGERPVFLVRLGDDLPRIGERYELERVPAVPGPGDLYRVLGRRVSGTPA
jgi:hypothetical protein